MHRCTFNRLIAITLVATISLVTSRGFAAINSWIDGTGKWETGANWSEGVAPNSTHEVVISNAPVTVTIDGVTAAGFPSSFVISNLTVSGAGTSLVMTNSGPASPLLIDRAFQIEGNAALLMSNATLEIVGPTFGPPLFLGIQTNVVNGTVTLLSGSQITATNLGASTENMVGMNGTGTILNTGGRIQTLNMTLGRFTNDVGTLIISGGTNEVGGFLRLGDGTFDGFGGSTGGVGRIWVNSGQLVTTNGNIFIGEIGNGTLTVSNGSVLAGFVGLGNNPASSGTLTIEGGLVDMRGGLSVGNTGLGTVWMNGGQMFLTNSVGIFIGGNGNFGAGHGLVTVSNGFVRTENIMLGSPAMFNAARGTLTMIGGTLEVGILDIRNKGFLNQVGGQLIITGPGTNSGVFVQNNADNLFQGPIFNHSGWITDPTTNTFLNDFYVTTNGYIQMAVGDVYIFSNDATQASSFINISTNNGAYDTRSGKFLFSNTLGATQEYASVGLDLGPVANTPTGVVTGDWAALTLTNFGLGEMELRGTSFFDVFVDIDLPDLTLFPITNGALYVSNLVLDANSTLIISSNINVYFLTSNDWAGATIQLEGNAGLHQLFNVAAIPEPSVIVLYLAGAATIWRARRRAGK